ncbi:MAG: hypothetical protein DDT26_02638 [Dehalococcoidia bacterium]|nr:hypothetical protein [Chloroflexota bacterium]
MTTPTRNSPDRTAIRVNLSLPVEVVAILDRMGAVTGAGRATIVREFLTEAVPHLSELARALEMAQGKNLDAFNLLVQTVNNALSQGDQLVLDIRKANRAARRKKQP